MTSLVLATWNVHGWIGRDERRDPDRSFEVIGQLGADVVALQEVEGDDWQARARAAGYEPLQGTTQAGYGNALLLRASASGVRRLDLSVPAREPRGALEAIVELSDGPLRVIATHLGLRASERRRQARQLARYVAARERALPIALLGDLNDWTPWGAQLAPIARSVGPLSRVSTFPSRRPILPLDRVACRLPDRTAAVAAVRSPAARSASDHLPLRLEARRVAATPTP